MTDVAVFGSANADLVLRVQRIPGPGETVLAGPAERLPGGKGANQAVAAARSGASVAFVGAVGADPEGELVREALGAAGVELSGLRTVVEPTGLAVVTVSADAENSIVVAPGANATMHELTDADRRLLAASRVLVGQLEVPLDGLTAAAGAAHVAGATVILNAAPSRRLPEMLWSCVDLLVVNEHEAADLIGDPSAAADPERAIVELLRLVPAVLITLGISGARYGDRGMARYQVGAPPVDAVDTTGAGDAFCGVLATGLAQQRTVMESMQRAAAAAALCVQRAGAIPSIPSTDEIERLWRATYSRDRTVLDDAKILAAPDDPP